MSGPIQRRPLGFLDALNLKSLGRNPEQTSDFVQPVYEMRHHYEADVLRQISASAAAVATRGFNKAPITVPSGEAWWVHNVGNLVTLAGGAVTDIFVGIGLQLQGGSFAQLLSGVRYAGLGAAFDTVGAPLDLELVLPPASVISTYLGVLTGGGNVDVVTQVTYTPLSV